MICVTHILFYNRFFFQMSKTIAFSTSVTRKLFTLQTTPNLIRALNNLNNPFSHVSYNKSSKILDLIGTNSNQPCSL